MNIVNSEKSLLEFIDEVKGNYEKHKYTTYECRNGVDRTIKQNKLIYLIYKEIGNCLYGGDCEHARAECKLTIGVDILRENENYNRLFGRSLDHLGYHEKLEMIKMIDITSVMTRTEAVIYTNKVVDCYTLRGIIWPEFLTDQYQKFINKEREHFIKEREKQRIEKQKAEG